MPPNKNPNEPARSITPSDPEFYRELLDQMSDGVYFVDRNRQIQYWNEGARRLTGYNAGELVGKHCSDNILCHVDSAGRSLCHDGCPLTATIADGAFHEASVFLRHKEGRRVPVLVRVHPLRGEDGSITGAIEIFSDDSAHNETRRKIEAMNRLAFLDHLTQLPNRRYLEMSLASALMEYAVHNDPLGILLIDFDEFKSVNDTFGHACGDRALQQTALTLVGSLRPADTVGRWGGDEFLAIVRNVNGEVLRGLGQRAVAMIKKTSIPSNDERMIPMSISVGAALSRPDETVDQFLRRADELLYRSKGGGRGCVTAD